MIDCFGLNNIFHNIPLPFVFENGDPVIHSNQKKYIVKLSKNKLSIDNSGLFTQLSLPTDLIEKYKFK